MPKPSLSMSVIAGTRNGWIFVSGLCMAIWTATSAASSEMLFFWPIFPSIGVGIGYASMVLKREERVEAIEDKLAAKRRRRRALGGSGAESN